MKKITLSFFIFIMTGPCILAQRAHLVYAEAGGAGLGYSLNYDVRLLSRPDGIGLRVGRAYTRSGWLTPIQLNYVFGKAPDRIEIGAGILLDPEELLASRKIVPTATLMYRLQSEDKRLVIRAGFSPLFVSVGRESVFSLLRYVYWLFPGFSVGYRL